ncbi:hypothetical protein BDQ12DRAFT_48246 [Crucibulum laeve]|uniref:Uncharacterized protein n=1 Tax=Crucibulum laeve TaxID=68775 RepID=A0A5C3MIS7_9AGAR|nr:hypothetical protein BDQ12DRAFT_48246 [Crucibulum laeve]
MSHTTAESSYLLEVASSCSSSPRSSWSWSSTTSVSSMEYKPQQRGQQAAHSWKQPSTSTTAESDLFPEILSWAALIDVQTTLRYTQSIPSDISKPEETDTASDDMSILSSLFDPTTLDIGFDFTCLEGMDDMLLHSPTDAFTATCWEQAVRVPLSVPGSPRAHSYAERSSTPTPLRLKLGQRGGLSPFLDHPSSPSSSESDSEESSTDNDEYSPLSPVDDHGDMSSLPSGGSRFLMTKGRSLFFDEYNTSFMMLEPHFPVSDPKDAVGFFPIPQQRSKPSRIAAFCANFPARLVRAS